MKLKTTLAITAAGLLASAVLLGACGSNGKPEKGLALETSAQKAAPGSIIGISARIFTANGQAPAISFTCSSGFILATKTVNEIDVMMPVAPGRVVIQAKAQAGSDSWTAQTTIEVGDFPPLNRNAPALKTAAGNAVIDKYFPPDTSKDVPKDTRIVMDFSVPMNQRSIENAFAITPQTAGLFTWNGNTCMFIPKNPLSSGKKYIVSIDKNMSTAKGSILRESVSWSFSIE